MDEYDAARQALVASASRSDTERDRLTAALKHALPVKVIRAVSLGGDSDSVFSSSYISVSASGTAPANSAIGAVTLYGEGSSTFDDCVVSGA